MTQSRRSGASWFRVAGCVALLVGIAGTGSAQVKRQPAAIAGAATAGGSIVSKVIDACQFAPADSLEKYLDVGIRPHFPIEAHKDGHHLKISGPNVTDVKCPNLRVEIKTNVKYQDTRGLVQFESSGHIRFGSPLKLLVQYRSTPGQPVKPLDVLSAAACFTNITVTELNLNNVPNWIDNGYVRSLVQQQLVPSACVPVVTFVRLYVAQGGAL